MPSIKVNPPSTPPDRGVSETELNIWCDELEVCLSQEKDLAVFLPGEPYENWESQEVNEKRLTGLKGANLDLIPTRDAIKDSETN